MDMKSKVKVFIDCGFTMSAIANAAGISKSTLIKWMNGERNNISEASQMALDAAFMDIADKIHAAVYDEETEKTYQYDDIVLN